MEKVRISIVEDEQIVALHLQDLLEGFGYEVIDTFITGEETIDTINNMVDHKPDLLFMDIRLGGKLDGVETVNRLLEGGFNIPIIYLTSNTDKDYITKAKLTKPIAFLKKPFDADQIKATLEISIHTSKENEKQVKTLIKSNELNQMQIEELMQTQQHLITATWRERELKEELQKTKAIIEEQNKKILDSINYARRIQRAIIPKAEELKQALGDYFMFYKPKDVVSGDFPWLFIKGDYVYVAAVDCTGHGVPGAMMSLIGYLLLNDVVHVDKQQTPADILNGLHAGVVRTLRQNEEGNRAADGMDIAMCRINKKTREIVYAGAHRPLYHLVGAEIMQYKGDKFPIGGMQYKGENHFTDIAFEVKKGEAIYFFSDGLPDQFGGPEKLKFGPKRVRDLILENREKSIEHQKEVFHEAFLEWTGEGKQLDDVLMIGVKF